MKCTIGKALMLSAVGFLGFTATAKADYIAGRDLLAGITNPGTTSATSTNPNGPWSYGDESTAGTGFTAYTTFTAQLVPNSPSAGQGVDLQGWENGTTNVPDASVNTTGTTHKPNFSPTDLALAPNEMFVHPGSSGAFDSVTRWTAPATGTYTVTAEWRLINGGAVGDTISIYDTPLSTGVSAPLLMPTVITYNANAGYFDATSTRYSSTIAVVQGDILDFITGPTSGNASDHTGFDVQITPSPEPGVLGIAACSTLGLLARRRKSPSMT